MRPRLIQAKLVTVLACALGATAASARGVNIPPDRLAPADRLERLEERLERLENGPAGWLTTRRAEEIRLLVTDVLADADGRIQERGAPVTAGYRKNVFLQSADGAYRVEFSGWMQVRYVASHQEAGPDDDDVRGFELRRLKLKFRGHLVDPRLKFAATIAYEDDTGQMELQGTSLSYELADGLVVRVGRFRPPLLREEEVSSRRQLLVERSLVARAFTQNRTLGTELAWETDDLELRGSVMASNDEPMRGDNWSVTGRAMYILQGRSKEARQYSSFPGDDPLLAVGAGVLYQDEEELNPGDPSFQRFRWTFDISAEFGGATLFAAVVGNDFDRDGVASFRQIGVVVQGGVFVTEQCELAARYSWGDADNGTPDLSVVEVGFNYYFEDEDIKWQTDIGYAFNPLLEPWPSSGASWRRDSPGQSGQVVIRSQIVLNF